MLRPSTPYYLTEDGREFFQNRVRQFGLIAFALGIIFWIFRATVLGHAARWDAIFEGSMIAHLCGALSNAFLWVFTVRGKRSVRYLQTMETIWLTASCVSYEVMGLYIPAIFSPWQTVVLALTFVFVARAIFVPSPPRFTFGLTVAAGIPLVILSYLSMEGSAEALLQANLPIEYMGPSSLTPRDVAWLNATGTGIWWLLTIILCTATSRVVYGLRTEAQTAKRLGQYALQEKIGQGGMGEVYRASHAMLRRPTAIKLLSRSATGETNLLRFEREVQLTAQLTHPNTITIFDYGRTPDGLFYYAMELLDGADLQALVEHTGPLEPARVARILQQIAGALSEAHGLGLIHRDIKPSNIILAERGAVSDVAKIFDFGLVKHVENKEDVRVTRANVITGTPLYMAPETITSSDAVDHKSDLYSLGAVGYFLLTGTHVFSGNTAVEVCSHHLHTAPTPPSERLGRPLPPVLETLIMSCLEKHPARRPADAHALEAALAAWPGRADWTDARARAWWAEHAELRLSNRLAAHASPRTIDIDLARRIVPARREEDVPAPLH